MKKLKYIFVFVIGMIALQSKSQTISEIVNVDTLIKKQTLYSNALTFFALEFKSANDVIQMKDAESGKVIGKGIVDNRQITIGISCKDGKYKYDIDIEPFKNVIQTDVNLNINKFGMYKGETIGELIWKNGILSISNMKFIFQNSYKWPNVLYNGIGKPIGMNNAYEKWKVLVDEEIIILTKKYDNMSNPNEERNKMIISNLILDIKNYMSKKQEW